MTNVASLLSIVRKAVARNLLRSRPKTIYAFHNNRISSRESRSYQISLAAINRRFILKKAFICCEDDCRKEERGKRDEAQKIFLSAENISRTLTARRVSFAG